MKVSIALHTGEPDPYGNQRALEAAYQNYNRQYADLEIDPHYGGATAAFKVTFPEAGETFAAYYFSIGTCVAPFDLGGSVIVYGSITSPLRGVAGDSPVLDAGVVVDADRMKQLDLVVQDGVFWREKTEDELKVTYPKAA